MKNLLLIASLIIVGGTTVSCKAANEKEVQENKEEQAIVLNQLEEGELKTAYFASGCFWCVEAIFQSVKGVKDAISGYAGGSAANPSYEQVSRGITDHAEVVKVIYDPTKIDFSTLVKVFFGSHDPTTPNRQGPDRGPQYRSIAFYQTAAEKKVIEDYIRETEAQNKYNAPIVTEVTPLSKFWEAEEYHQEYEQNHPENPYVQNVSIPRLERFKSQFPALLKENH